VKIELPGNENADVKTQIFVKEEKEVDENTQTDKQLRERNVALRCAMKEKTRQIEFLKEKCTSLFKQKHAMGFRLNSVINHWSTVVGSMEDLLQGNVLKIYCN